MRHNTSYISRRINCATALTVLLFAGMLAVSCTKSLGGDEEESEPPKEQPEETLSSQPYKETGSCLTVGQAIDAKLEEDVWVKGYIVGTTARSMSNANYQPPFTDNGYVLLADARTTDAGWKSLFKEDILVVRLNDYIEAQRAINLVDHPENYNRKIIIYGVKSVIFRQAAIGPLLYWRFPVKDE